MVRTALPDMDREVRDRYLLVIQAKDMIGQVGGLSGTTSVTVILTDVNDNPPRFPRSESEHQNLRAPLPVSLPLLCSGALVVIVSKYSKLWLVFVCWRETLI